MYKEGSILFVGVGGQGTILASKVLSRGLMDMGFDVKMSEVHGMAQRGGSVSTQVRYAHKVYSPLIEPGRADAIVSFEKSEAGRWIHFLKQGGTLIANNHEIRPYTVNVGKETYPEGLFDELTSKIEHSFIIDADAEAKALGNVKVSNMVLLGRLIMSLQLEDYDWETLILDTFPEKLARINVEALKIGMKHQ